MPARKDKLFVVASVAGIKRELQKRLKVAEAIVKELQRGATAKQVPLKHRHEPAGTSAGRIKRQLEAAIQLMDDECGDNVLANPYLLSLKKKRGR